MQIYIVHIYKHNVHVHNVFYNVANAAAFCGNTPDTCCGTGCLVVRAVPSVEKDTFHVEGVVSDKHVPLHPQLQNAGRSHWLHQGNEKWFTAL